MGHNQKSAQKSHRDQGRSGVDGWGQQGQSKGFGEGAGFNPSRARITPPTCAGVPAELEEGEQAPSRA